MLRVDTRCSSSCVYYGSNMSYRNLARNISGESQIIMNIPKPNLNPPFNIVRFSHVELAVSDLELSTRFYVEVLGLNLTGEDGDGRVYLRAMEERGHHCIVLCEDDRPECRSVGFKVFDDSDLDGVESYFRSRNLPTERVERPYMDNVLQVRDPWGIPLEFYTRMALLPTIHQKYSLYRGVRPLRIDHINMYSPDVDNMSGFYNDIGFRITEYTQDTETGRLWATWLHRKGNVHDIAFTNGLGPRMHHIAFWVASPLHIIDLLDCMSTSGYLANIERGPGRHGISNAFFLYVRDPDNHRIELYSSDYQTIDPDHAPIKWDLHDPTRQTLWGTPAPRSWFEEGSTYAGTELSEPVHAGTPIIAP